MENARPTKILLGPLCVSLVLSCLNSRAERQKQINSEERVIFDENLNNENLTQLTDTSNEFMAGEELSSDEFRIRNAHELRKPSA